MSFLIEGFNVLRIGSWPNHLNLLAATVVVAVVAVFYFTNTHIEQIIASKANDLGSGTPSVAIEAPPELINESSHGIIENIDLPKRQVAKDVIQNYRDFEYLFFLLPIW